MAVGSLPDVTYNGESQQQKPVVKDGDKALAEGVDYELTYSGNATDAGTVTVTVTGKGNYAGSVDVTYLIAPAPLTVTTPSASGVYNAKPPDRRRHHLRLRQRRVRALRDHRLPDRGRHERQHLRHRLGGGRRHRQAGELRGLRIHRQADRHRVRR